MKTSMLKTLAHRHRSTVTAMAGKYKAVTATPYGPRRCFEARVERHGRKPLAARFGGIPLRRQRDVQVAGLGERGDVPGRPARLPEAPEAAFSEEVTRPDRCHKTCPLSVDRAVSKDITPAS